MFWEVYALDRQEYLKSLTEQIRTKRARTMVAEEVEAHIEDQKQDFMAHGLGEEAESMAVIEMGDPVEAGVKLDRVHRPKMDWTDGQWQKYSSDVIVLSCHTILRRNNLSFPRKRNERTDHQYRVPWNISIYRFDDTVYVICCCYRNYRAGVTACGNL